jgi:glycosyltransferase involved in cell wall biosynthesis
MKQKRPGNTHTETVTGNDGRTTAFSVVIPLYNKEATIERALRSVLSQTVQDFEIVVVNDGSTDNGQVIIESITDPRIRLIHQKNQGVSAARNRGVAEATHDLIAFLDADDEWLPEFLETMRRLYLRYPSCGLYATRYLFGTSNGKRLPAIVRGLPADFVGIINGYFRIAARSHPPLHSSAVCVRRSVLLQIGGFPVGVISGEDLLTWARIAVRFPLAYCMSCLSIFHQPTEEINQSVPTRVPAEDDVVGKGLGDLLNSMKDDRKPYLRRYCALWHKMRASCYLRLGMRLKGRAEVLRAMKYDMTLKVAAFWILSFLPLAAIHKAFRAGTLNR